MCAAEMAGPPVGGSHESRKSPEGRAALDVERTLHVTREPGVALCGSPVVAYDLHWATTTRVICTGCVEEVRRG